MSEYTQYEWLVHVKPRGCCIDDLDVLHGYDCCVDFTVWILVCSLFMGVLYIVLKRGRSFYVRGSFNSDFVYVLVQVD